MKCSFRVVSRPNEVAQEFYLGVLPAVLLVASCILLQVPIHLAALTLVSKNVAVAVTLILGIIAPVIAVVLWLSPDPRITLRLNTIPPATALHTATTSLSFTLLASGSLELMLRWERLPQRILQLMEREEWLFREVFVLNTSWDIITLGLVLIVLAPVAEELLFRAALQGSLERHVGPWCGVLISGLAFGALHGQLRCIPMGLFGILMGYLVMRTNALLVGILAHAVNNFTVLMVSLHLESNMASTWQLAVIAILGGLGLPVFLRQFRSSAADCLPIASKRTTSSSSPLLCDLDAAADSSVQNFHSERF